MTTLFTFPGQGSQRAGMLHDLPAARAVRDAIAEASDVLATDVLALDAEPALHSTLAAQLCLLVAGVAMARHLLAQSAPPDAVAGHSVGAYAAAVVASAIGYRDALRLVQERARLMQAACPSGFGMTAILGLDVAALAPLIARVHRAASPVYLANINAPTQLVIAGARAAMAEVAALAQARGAVSAKPLAIDVPSHCALLADAGAALERRFADVAVSRPTLRYYSASQARELRDPRQIARELAFNMALPVQWHETVALAGERGSALIVEMPPGHVLTKLATAALPQALAVAADETRGDTLVELIAREARSR